MLVEQHGIDAASIASLDFHAAMTGYHEEVRAPPPAPFPPLPNTQHHPTSHIKKDNRSLSSSRHAGTCSL